MTKTHKVGIDDWFAAKGLPWALHEFEHLERIGLDDPRFKTVVDWYQKRAAKQAEAEAARTKSTEEPEEEVLGSTYRYTWPAHTTEIVLDGVHHAGETVKAELTANLINGARRIPILSNVTFNLSAPNTRKTFARQLTGQHAYIPWDSMLEVVCRRAIARYRQGEPVQTIGPNISVEALTIRLAAVRLRPSTIDSVR